MFKKLSFFALIFLLASCKNMSLTSKKTDEKNSESAQEKVEDKQEPFQTVENEAQAVELDNQTKIESEEIEVQDRILFNYDSSEINDEAKKILDTQAEWLKSDTSIKVTIEGHCDERGTREYNIALGEKRANAAKTYLIEKGVADSRIQVISYGKERPAFFGADDESMAKNRRAVTVIN